jgi:hypothetical protein
MDCWRKDSLLVELARATNSACQKVAVAAACCTWSVRYGPQSRSTLSDGRHSRLSTCLDILHSSHRLLPCDTNKMGKGLSPASPAMFRPANGASIKAATQMQAQALDPANPAPPASATNIAEQLDDQERRKYVKGTPFDSCLTLIFAHPSQARNSVLVNTPMSSPLTSSRIPPSSSP